MITVKEVKETENDLDSGKPAPLIISYVNMKEACELLDR